MSRKTSLQTCTPPPDYPSRENVREGTIASWRALPFLFMIIIWKLMVNSRGKVGRNPSHQHRKSERSGGSNGSASIADPEGQDGGRPLLHLRHAHDRRFDDGRNRGGDGEGSAGGRRADGSFYSVPPR